MTKRMVPKATLQRYPIYLKALRKLEQQGVEKVMSKDLAELVDIEPTTIRRDFSFIGTLGRQGYGYDVKKLLEVFSNELGMVAEEKLILVGAGNLGRALMKYNGWDHIVGEIVCAFDINEDRLGVRFDVPVYHLNDLEKDKPEDSRIAILAISHGVQETVDRLIACGITGIVDFTQEHIQVPRHVLLRHVDVVSAIQEIIFEANALDK
ncbi:MAG: redox-sensing transcriptional repressor Rex [Erysipelotrichales bacterium]|nr:redox-sensing transcriptional repressor Rex [Erysipelotrichales bacterium]